MQNVETKDSIYGTEMLHSGKQYGTGNKCKEDHFENFEWKGEFSNRKQLMYPMGRMHKDK